MMGNQSGQSWRRKKHEGFHLLNLFVNLGKKSTPTWKTTTLSPRKATLECMRMRKESMYFKKEHLEVKRTVVKCAMKKNEKGPYRKSRATRS